MFFLFGVLCNDEKRKERLEGKGLKPEEAVSLMERDKKEKDKHGQQVLKTIQHSDFFIRNTNTNFTAIKQPLDRFVQLILSQNNITPTKDEFGMYIAESAARMSGCMSRQVGAAILSEAGDIISTGRNDVPKPNGGLYREEDGDNDKRCFKLHDKSCENSKRIDTIYNKISDLVRQKFKNITTEKNKKDVYANITSIIKALQDDSEIKDLLEYSKAVHAEMDAIITAARNGNVSLRGTTLYSTTFPCHHCARHIIASGIKTVYYIEPYEKSLAKQLHSDAIDLDSQKGTQHSKKVRFLHFEGVAPKQYLDLFSCNDRKEKGRLKNIALNTQRPAISSYLDSFIDYESKVVELLEKNSEQPGEKQDEL